MTKNTQNERGLDFCWFTTIGTIVLYAAVIWLLLFNGNAAAMSPDGAPDGHYMSYCKHDKACEKREIEFISSHGRTPITDSELCWTYDVELSDILNTAEAPVIPYPMKLCKGCNLDNE